MMKAAHILIVEDEALVAEDIKIHLEDIGYIVSGIIASGEDALSLLEGSIPDLILMDIMLNGKLDGIDVAKVIKEKYQIPVVFLTAYTDKEKLGRAMKTEPYGYLLKPFDERELRTTISVSLYKAESERKLRKSERLNSAILDSIADAVITTNKAYEVNYINPQAEILTGHLLKDNKGESIKNIMKLVTTEQQMELYKSCDYIIQQQYTSKHKQPIKKLSVDLMDSNNHIKPINISISLISYNDGNGGSDGLVIAFQDMTLHNEAEKILKQSNEVLELKVAERTHEMVLAKEEAEAANRAKNDFLSTMNHEIRTPLAPAMTYAQLQMDNPSLPESIRRQAKDTYSACNDLLRIFDNMLDFIQSGSGDLVLLNYPFDLLLVTRQVIVSVQSSCQLKGLKFKIHLPETELIFVQGDHARISQILNLLLNNAIKFTSSGEISLSLESHIQTSNKDIVNVKYTISDTGIGIADKNKKQIFDAFTQIDCSSARPYEGTGMGLALCKRLVEHMNGKIYMQDKDSEGSLFIIELSLPLYKLD